LGLILLDTSILIDHLRKMPEARDAMLAATDAGDMLAASLVTKIELMAGMRSHERRSTRDVMATIHWIGLEDEIAEKAGAFARRYRRSYMGIDIPDFIIAATADHVGAELWTRNIKHFPMFPELLPPY
jgi:predicted nucleic acid-binding protein